MEKSKEIQTVPFHTPKHALHFVVDKLIDTAGKDWNLCESDFLTERSQFEKYIKQSDKRFNCQKIGKKAGDLILDQVSLLYFGELEPNELDLLPIFEAINNYAKNFRKTELKQATDKIITRVKNQKEEKNSS